MKGSKIEEFIKSLSEEEYQELVNKLQPKQKPLSTYDGLITIDTSMGNDYSTLARVAVKPYTLDSIKLVDIPKGKYAGSLTDEQRIHMLDSQYTANWMYPAVMCNVKLTHMEMLLGNIDYSDQIDSDHEQYSYFFNMHRDNVGLPKIELKVGDLYELQFGRKRDIVKRMILVDIKDGLKSNKIPELYFENEHTYYNNKGHRMNINHIKIWRKLENGK